MDRKAIRIFIGKNIRHRRESLGLSLQDVSEKLKVSYQQLQKYEKGINGIYSDKLIDIAHILRCSIGDLCKGTFKRPHLFDYIEDPKPYSRGTTQLIRLYNKITNPKSKKAVLAMMRAIVADVKEDAHEQKTLG